MNIPLRELTTAQADLPAGQIVTVCSMGNRSLRGAQTLARLEHTAVSLRGGTKAWATAGFPIVTGTEPGAARREPLWRRLTRRFR